MIHPFLHFQMSFSLVTNSCNPSISEDDIDPGEPWPHKEFQASLSYGNYRKTVTTEQKYFKMLVLLCEECMKQCVFKAAAMLYFIYKLKYM